jgi:multiple sugar transport system substrate-binding protein
MTQELELSIMSGTLEAGRQINISSLLEQFEAKHHVHVRLRHLAWDTAWSQLVKVALYGDGPDVSEVGSTWVGDLIAMNELRPFTAAETASLGGPVAFVPAAWSGGTLAGGAPASGGESWAIPWLLGARLILYRRNLLAQAGIEEQSAFNSIDAFSQTIARLHQSGVEIPWVIPTLSTHTTLLNAASWVWGAGGDFLSEDGRRTRFNEPAARAGLRAYFSLGRYLSPAGQRLSGVQPDDLFAYNQGAAVTLSGSWLYTGMKEQKLPLFEQIGVALPPGPSFVGGSYLVVWRHTRKTDAALKLIRFLTETETQVAYSGLIGLLPARLQALNEPSFASDPMWQTAVQGLQTGRSFPVTPLWGLVEDRLSTELSHLWADVLADPDLDLDAALTRRLEPLAHRLDITLSQR